MLTSLFDVSWMSHILYELARSLLSVLCMDEHWAMKAEGCYVASISASY